MNVIGQLHEAG